MPLYDCVWISLVFSAFINISLLKIGEVERKGFGSTQQGMSSSRLADLWDTSTPQGDVQNFLSSS